MTTIDTSLPNPINGSYWVRDQGEIEADLAALRAVGAPTFHDIEIPEGVEIPEGSPGAEFFDQPGSWVVTKLDQILEVSKNPQTYCSGKGMTILDTPPEFNEFFSSMIAMDDPRHARLRKLVSAGFTPKMLNQLQGSVQDQARMIVNEVGERGECDFVVDVAARLPLKIVCDLMAIPDSHLDFVFEQSNFILGAGDPEYAPPDGVDGLTAMLMAGASLAELMTDVAKTKEGTDSHDLTTLLVNAEVDGEKLSHADIASFFILLVVAGNETTRNAISWGLHYLTENPDQRRIWADDFEGVGPRAVEEIVRLASPVTYMRRTATHDTVLGGQDIAEGDKVSMFYLAANRDEDHFADPYTFDVRRDPNNHVGFGGPGPHFCMGAHLARREILVMFRELFEHLPDIHATGAPDCLASSFIHGVKHLPASFTPTGPRS